MSCLAWVVARHGYSIIDNHTLSGSCWLLATTACDVALRLLSTQYLVNVQSGWRASNVVSMLHHHTKISDNVEGRQAALVHALELVQHGVCVPKHHAIVCTQLLQKGSG